MQDVRKEQLEKMRNTNLFNRNKDKPAIEAPPPREPSLALPAPTRILRILGF